jgi:hypothetical protein
MSERMFGSLVLMAGLIGIGVIYFRIEYPNAWRRMIAKINPQLLE